MRIGISTASFFKKKATEDTYDIIRKMGIPVCETFLASYSETKPKFVSTLKERKGDIEVKSIHTLSQQYEPELISTVDRARHDSEYFLKKAMRAAKELGASYYTFHGPAKLKRTPYTFDYEKLGTRIEEICRFVQKSSEGITSLTYENVHWCYFSEPNYFTEIKKYSPSVKACLDIKQAMQSGFSPSDYIRTMGERLTNVHLCDYNGSRTVLPGKGQFDFVSFFDELLSCGYKGDALLEAYSGDYESFDELEESYNYLNECLYKVQR